MKALLIEDISLKADKINGFFKENYPNVKVDIFKSFQSGLRQLFSTTYDLVLLDMSLPTFDIKPGESGYKFRKLGGIDILKEIKRKRNNTKVIIITQWTTFERDQKIVALSDLKKEMLASFDTNYLGTVFYSGQGSKWQEDLKEMIFANKLFD